MRPKCLQFEAERNLPSGCEHYEDEIKRHHQRNRLYDEPGSASEVELKNPPISLERRRFWLLMTVWLLS